MSAQKRKAIITGGSKGIGKAIAERFAQENIDIFLLAPRKTVSSVPLALRILSVKIKPLSGSAANWISSIDTKEKDLSKGIDSTVQKKYLAKGGIIFSSPVTKATFSLPTWIIAFS